MKYITLFMTVLYIVCCIFIINYFNKCENFYSELDKTTEILNDKLEKTLFYWKSVEWEPDNTSFTIDTFRIETDLGFWDSGNVILEDLYLMGDVVVYADQFSGNLYVINAKGDTIFKYIKKKNTTYLGIDSTQKNLYFHNKEEGK